MTITRQAILPLRDFLEIRPQKRQEILEIKKNRRIQVGPYISFYFESYDTIWWQIHEMLRIENGGEQQLEDELLAYEPLVPKKLPDGGQELVATMMIEIEDLGLRNQMLRLLDGIEKYIFLKFGNHKIQAVSETEVDRSQDGKTSSVHFLKFQLSLNDWDSFQKSKEDTYLIIEHAHYHYSFGLLQETHHSLVTCL